MFASTFCGANQSTTRRRANYCRRGTDQRACRQTNSAGSRCANRRARGRYTDSRRQRGGRRDTAPGRHARVGNVV